MIKQDEWTLVHDLLLTVGGAERVLGALARTVVPSAAIKTIAYRGEIAAQLGILPRTSRLRRWLPNNNMGVRALAPVVQKSLASITIEGNVLASSYAFAHLVRATGRKVVYCHSPLRQIWARQGIYGQGIRGTVYETTLEFSGMRVLDTCGARHADAYVASCRLVASRIQQLYGFPAHAVIAPPIDSVFLQAPLRSSSDYVLWFGRIVEPYKRLGLLIEIFNELGLPLVIAGEGRDRNRLQRIAKENIEFVGSKTAGQLTALLAGAAAFVYPSYEDFGMAPLEALAVGVPAIVSSRAGNADIVAASGGLVLEEFTVSSIRSALQAVRSAAAPSELRGRVLAYGEAAFSAKMQEVMANE